MQCVDLQSGLFPGFKWQNNHLESFPEPLDDAVKCIFVRIHQGLMSYFD